MNPPISPLLTDLYQLTMLQAYFQEGLTGTACFELFVRRLPPGRNFLVAAGLPGVLEELENLRFPEADCAWLAEQPGFTQDFAERLAGLRFTGDVDALPEGSVFFQNEPMMRITAPLPEAQLVETRLINLVQLQTMMASKAARSVLAAPDKRLVEFGLRRAHGAEAGLLAARSAYLAGFAGSSNVLACREFGVPLYGTMAHAYVMAHASEEEAFLRFAESQAGNLVLLIDTYDTLAAARKLVGLAPRLAERGIPLRAVRLDSGDLVALSKQVRAILDQGGLSGCQIFASGDLDEYEISRLLAEGAPIDGFGVGTRLATSVDAPYLSCVYKLQEYAGTPRRKRSAGKATWPGRKQVFRVYDAAGRMRHDVLAEEGEAVEGEPLLRPVMRAGQRLDPPEPLELARERLRQQLGQLPEALRSLEVAEAYPVEISPGVRQLAERLDAEQAG